MDEEELKKDRLPRLDKIKRNNLSSEELEWLAKQIASKAGDQSGCSVCGENAWQIFPKILTATEFDIENDRHIHNKVVPLILSICTNCGNTNQFFAWHFNLRTKGHFRNDPEGGK